MDIGKPIASLFKMDDATWQRHASPWSVYTRIPMLFVFVAILWFRTEMGWWTLLPLALALLWTWINPRAFPPPKSTNNWASKGVFGERVWINRKNIPIPAHHQRMVGLLVAVSLLGSLTMILGLIFLNLPLALAGTVTAFFGKMWFVDRMVWLYEDMKDASPEYQSWLRE